MSEPRVSVLIATLGRPELLQQCLEAIFAASRRPDQIVIADQSDDDRTERVVRDFPAGDVDMVYERLTRRGKSRALNHALAASSGELLALTDDDVMVSDSWITTILALAARHPQADAFCGRVLPEEGTDPADYLNLVLSEEERWIDRTANPLTPAFCGANVAIRRQALVDVGGYNVHFGPGGCLRNNDDGELAYRLTRQNGSRILYTPELHVVHSGWRKDGENVQLMSDYAFSLGALGGFYLRQGHLRPAWYLLRKSVSKCLRILTGIVTLQRARVADGWMHLRSFASGFWRGLGTAAEPSGVPA